ncbi:MAG TPA: HIT family protein [Candidatus Tyrphobacter sp.]|nr:HIT family protein [Candidatus Tyrphobacter sp.]
MDCLFCKLANKELKAEIIYEDEAAVAFLDIHPIAPGHTLVLPKIHAENILDLPDEAVKPLFLALKKTTELLQKSLKPEGFTIGINHGKISGQAIDHLHIHVIPRFKNDGGRSLHFLVQNIPSESLQEIKSKIINQI